jgi:hypothetical protein
VRVWLVLSFQRSALWPTSHPTLELCFHCVGLLGTCFFALHPFSGARSEICQLALCCQCVMLVCWLFFNFATLSDFGCCSLAQEMSFVVRYLPYFRQWITTARLPFQSFFTESSWGDQLLAFPSSPVCSELPTPSAACSFFSSLFIIHFFCRVGVSLFRGLCWVIPGVAVGILRATYLLTCWSVSPKQVWSWHLAVWEPSCFYNYVVISVFNLTFEP